MRSPLWVWWLEARSALSRLRALIRRSRRVRVRNLCAVTTPARGTALISYLARPLLWAPHHPGFLGHSNAWECAEIGNGFRGLGFSVDAIDWDDDRFASRRPYTAVFDIHRNLSRFAHPDTRKFLHSTGSHPVFSNAAELLRLQELKRRRGISLEPRRSVPAEDVRLFDQSLELADVVSLIGNATTLSTFAPRHRHKIRLVTATGSFLPRRRSDAQPPRSTVFLWFGGVGAVHKGLDLVLEVFARNPDLELHVVGPYEREIDFVKAYRNELYESRNVRAHGFLRPSDPLFLTIADRTAAFLAPSCSEGISTSAITCMQFGMIPLLSRQCGIDIPPDCGVELRSCSLDEIEGAVRGVAALGQSVVVDATVAVQRFAGERFSRDAFSSQIRAVIADGI